MQAVCVIYLAAVKCLEYLVTFFLYFMFMLKANVKDKVSKMAIC